MFDQVSPLESEKIRQPAWLVWAKPIGLAVLALLSVFYLVEAINYLQELHNGMFDTENRPLGRDFINWWTAAKLVSDGHIMTLFDVERYREAQAGLFGQVLEPRNWSYPPHVLPWILGLGFLPYSMAFAVWVCLGLIIYVFVVAYNQAYPWKLAVILVLAPSSAINIIEGQTGFFTAACLVGGFRLLDRAPVLSGILFGVLSFKPHIAIFVPVALLAGRYWKTFAMAILTMTVLVGFSIGVFGVEPWAAYFEKIIPYQRLILEADLGQRLAYQFMMISPFMAERMLGGSVAAAFVDTGMAALLSLGAVIYVFMNSRSLELRMAVTMTAAFFAAPHMFTYDMPALSAAALATVLFALGTGKTREGGRRLNLLHLVLLSAVWFLPLVAGQINQAGLPISPFVTGGLLLLQVLWAKPPSLSHSPTSRTPV